MTSDIIAVFALIVSIVAAFIARQANDVSKDSHMPILERLPSRDEIIPENKGYFGMALRNKGGPIHDFKIRKIKASSSITISYGGERSDNDELIFEVGIPKRISKLTKIQQSLFGN